MLLFRVACLPMLVTSRNNQFYQSQIIPRMNLESLNRIPEQESKLIRVKHGEAVRLALK